MLKLLSILPVAVVTACGGMDTRPATLEFVTLEVLSPSCGTVACHSTTSNISGYAFDTIDASREALRRLVQPGNPDRSRLIRIIRDRSMPPDAPMSDLDVALLEDWIAAGAEGLQ
jgi:hypothetical protein